MHCSKCASLEDKVIDSRLSKDGRAIRRRRECLKCGHRFTTYEEVERTELACPEAGWTERTFLEGEAAEWNTEVVRKATR
jgi:transcriptional regulator NrdR family protein